MPEAIPLTIIGGDEMKSIDEETLGLDDPCADALDSPKVPGPPRDFMFYFIWFTITATLIIILSVSVLGIGWGAQHALKGIDGVVISPFPDIVAENDPNSAVPCYYPAMDELYGDSHQCDFESIRYCPAGYICRDSTNSGASPYGCFSEYVYCGSNPSCERTVVDLALYEGNPAARVLSNTLSPFPVWSQALLIPLITAIIVLALAGSHKYPEYSKRLFAVAAVSLISLIVLCIVGIIIFAVTSPVYIDSDYQGSCFGEEINSKTVTAGGFGVAMFVATIYYLFGSLLFSPYVSLIILVLWRSLSRRMPETGTASPTQGASPL